MELFTGIHGIEYAPADFDGTLQTARKYVPDRVLKTICWNSIINGYRQYWLVFPKPQTYHSYAERKKVEAAEKLFESATEKETRKLNAKLLIESAVEKSQSTVDEIYSRLPWYRRWFGLGADTDPDLLIKLVALSTTKTSLVTAEKAYNQAWEEQTQAGQALTAAETAYKEKESEWLRWYNQRNPTVVIEYGLCGVDDPRESQWFERNYCKLSGKPLKFSSGTVGVGSNGIREVYSCLSEPMKEMARASMEAKNVYCEIMRPIFRDRYVIARITEETPRAAVCGQNYEEYPEYYPGDASEEILKIWETFSPKCRRQAWYFIHSADKLGWRVVRGAVVDHHSPAEAFRVMCTGASAVYWAQKRGHVLNLLKSHEKELHKETFGGVLDQLVWNHEETIFYRDLFKTCAGFAADSASQRNYENYQILYKRATVLADIPYWEQIVELTPLDTAVIKRKHAVNMRCLKNTVFFKRANQEISRRNYALEHARFVATVAKAAKRRTLLKKFVEFAKTVGYKENIYRSLIKSRYSKTLTELTTNYYGIRRQSHRSTLIREIPVLSKALVAKRLHGLWETSSRAASLTGLKWSLKNISMPEIPKEIVPEIPKEINWAESLANVAASLMYTKPVEESKEIVFEISSDSDSDTADNSVGSLPVNVLTKRWETLASDAQFVTVSTAETETAVGL